MPGDTSVGSRARAHKQPAAHPRTNPKAQTSHRPPPEDSARCRRGNDRRDICHCAGPFGRKPQSCFQLRNRDLGQPRHYDQHVDVDTMTLLDAANDSGGCLLRRGLNQPMRNIALANVLAEGGEAVVYALCAPGRHSTIWRRWGEARAVFAGHKAVTLGDLPAETLLPLHPEADALRKRYQLQPG
jgi:hypothetical protein